MLRHPAGTSQPERDHVVGERAGVDSLKREPPALQPADEVLEIVGVALQRRGREARAGEEGAKLLAGAHAASSSSAVGRRSRTRVIWRTRARFASVVIS